MSRAKFRVHYEKSFQCRCGKWKARARDECCTACAIRAEERDVAEVKARVRAKLDPGPLCDDQGRPAA